MANNLNNHNDPETRLTGGRTAVWQRGNVVLRETGPWAPTVHKLLEHLEDVEFPGAPRVVGTGFDDKGREMLTFIEGEFVHPGPWSEKAFYWIGRFLRDLHTATSSFVIPDDSTWRGWHGRSMGGSQFVIGHCDTGPWNFLSRGKMPFALIDWEDAGPVDPRVELAQCCWLNAQLHDDDIAEKENLSPLEDRARHVKLILDGFELSQSQRSGFVDVMIEFAVHDAVDQVMNPDVTPETRDPSSLWGITWRTRSASWMLRHRATLERIISSNH